MFFVLNFSVLNGIEKHPKSQRFYSKFCLMETEYKETRQWLTRCTVSGAWHSAPPCSRNPHGASGASRLRTTSNSRYCWPTMLRLCSCAVDYFRFVNHRRGHVKWREDALLCQTATRSSQIRSGTRPRWLLTRVKDRCTRLRLEVSRERERASRRPRSPRSMWAGLHVLRANKHSGIQRSQPRGRRIRYTT